MKYLNARVLSVFVLLAVASFVLVSCLSEKQASDIDNKIDAGTKLVNGVLVATGNGAAAPVVAAGGALAKWVIGLLTVGGTATGAAVTQHVHGGLPFTERRTRLKDEDLQWDDLLAHVQHSLPQLQAAATAAGDQRAQQQAARVAAVLAALKPAEVSAPGSI